MNKADEKLVNAVLTKFAQMSQEDGLTEADLYGLGLPEHIVKQSMEDRKGLASQGFVAALFESSRRIAGHFLSRRWP